MQPLQPHVASSPLGGGRNDSINELGGGRVIIQALHDIFLKDHEDQEKSWMFTPRFELDTAGF
jgi:hypothetical protein